MVQLGITLKNAVCTTNAYSQDVEDGLVQFFTSSGLGRQLLHSIYTRVNPGADKQRLNQLLRWHSDAQCSPEEAVALLLDLGIPRRRLRVLSRFISKRADVWYKQTGLRFGKPMPGRRRVNLAWKTPKLGALQNHEEGRRKVKSMPTWVNLRQGGSTLHSPEATEKKASTTRAGVRGKDPQPVVSGRRAKNLAEILSSYKKTKKPKKRPRAKPAAKEPPKKKARLLPGESSESEEFEETEEDEEEEPPSGDEEEEPPARDDDDEDETQETQIPDRGALPWAWLPLQQEDQWGAWRGVPISKWRPWQTEIPRDILQQKTKLGRAGTIFWVPADYNSAMWHSVGEYCVAARSYATEGECKNAAAVASATGGVPAPSARKKKVKAKRPKKKKKTPTKSGGKQEEEDAGEGDKEDTETKDEVAVLVSGSES